MEATLKPIATINIMDDRFNAIWFAACGFFPNNPLNHMAAVKMATSKNICMALGAPRFIIFLSMVFSKTKNLIWVTKGFDFSLFFNIHHKNQTIMILESNVP